MIISSSRNNRFLAGLLPMLVFWMDSCRGFLFSTRNRRIAVHNDRSSAKPDGHPHSQQNSPFPFRPSFSSSNTAKENDNSSKFRQRHKYWVVIVDDEESIRMAVGDFLYDHGYELTACSDAEALLEVCRTPRIPGELPRIPDAIVSDIRMPGTDGIELLTQIRADDRLKRVPVLLLTAKGMTQDRIEGFNAGADAYITKPFEPEELLAILDNRILRRSQMKGATGKLEDLKQEMADIKELMKRNGSVVVKKTDVYLTDAEREVLTLLSKGFTNAEIAQERGVGLPRIATVIQKLYQKTQTQTRTELVRWALQTGYVPPR